MVLVLLPLLAGSAAAAHPQLYFSSADVAGLKGKVAADPYRSWFAGVQQLAVETPFPSGPTLSQQNLGDAAVALRTNAFVYAVTGDQTYGLRARGYLLKACTWPYWQDADRIAHGQTVSYMSGTFQGAVAETYDWIYPLLSAEEKATVQQAMVTRSLQPLIAQHGSDVEAQDFDTNRIALAQGGVGLAAIALKDDLPGNTAVSSASTIVHDTLLAEYFNRFDRDGAWNEGIGYLSFGLANDAGGSGAIYYAEALRRSTGENLFLHQKFSKAPDFLLYFLPPDRKGESSAFGDEDFSESFRSAGAAALASRTGNAYAQWYYRNAPLRSPDPIGDILFTDTTLPAQSPASLPPSRWFRDAGWVAMRTGWDTDDTLVGFKSGPFNPGNDRPEQNSFFLDALGERLVLLPGVSTQGYSDSSYWTWYRATVSQNTIMLDKDTDSQVIHPPDGSSVITRFLSSPSCDMTQGSAAPVYKGKLSKYIRDLVFVKHDAPGYLIVYDDLAATRAVEFDFLLHGLGSGSVKTNTFGTGTISITRPTARLYAKIVSPDTLRYTVLTGKPTDISGSNQPTSYVRVAPSEKTTATRFLTVLYPLGSSETAPRVTDISGTSFDGVTVVKNDWKDTVLFSTTGATLRHLTTTTDGRMVILSEQDGDLRGFSLQDATTLTAEGKKQMTSTKPVSAAIQFTGDGFLGTVQATSAASVTFPSGAPKEVKVNGVVTTGYTWNSAAGTLTFSLPAGDTAIQVTFSGSTPPPNPSPSPTPTPTPTPEPPPPPEPGLVTTTETATTSTYLGYSSSYVRQAQSVKAAGTGIDRVAIALARKGNPTLPITVRLRSTLKGTDLATATITPAMVSSTSSTSPGWVEVSVGRQGILTAGSPLYVVLDTGTYDLKNYYYVPLNSRNPYPDGNHYRGTSYYTNAASDMLVKVWFT